MSLRRLSNGSVDVRASVAAAPHRRVDGDTAALIVFDRNLMGDNAWNDARRQHDRAGVDDLVSHAHATGLDGLHRGRHVDGSAAPAEHVRGESRKPFVDLGEDARTGFEQAEVDFVAPIRG